MICRAYHSNKGDVCYEKRIPGDGIENSHLSQHWCIDHLVPPVYRKANRTFVIAMSCLHSLEDLRSPHDFCVRGVGERDARDVNTEA